MITNKMIRTDRALMPLQKLQHMSWKELRDDDVITFEVKLWSASGTPIVQVCGEREMELFLEILHGVIHNG
tara:strand:+ start:1381 stop:1593 length:213 start_codon:yes stop_codon:yes gene_type:complete